MSQELFYTSAPRGLKPGSSGFCTVAMTEGLSPVLADRLELLSAYKPLFNAGHPRAADNPVAYAHWKVSVGASMYSVLTRVGFAGVDYTQRTNKFAHHLVLSANEQPAAGPAWVMMQPGVMETQWRGEAPHTIPAGREAPQGSAPPGICQSWAAATGDSGWGGALAEAYIADPHRPAYVIYPPGVETLPLVAEAMAMLPAAHRWQVTFQTYFVELPVGLSCSWRFCAAGSPAAKEAVRQSKAGKASLLIDLGKDLDPAPESRLVMAARYGSDGAPPKARGRQAPARAAAATGGRNGDAAVYALGDEAEARPREAADAPRRRLGAVAVAPVAEEPSVDDDAPAAPGQIDWAPEPGVKPAASKRKPRAGAAPAWLWAIAVTGPIIAAALAYNLGQKKSASDRGGDPAAHATDGGSAPDVTELKGRLAQSEAQLETLQNMLRELQSQQGHADWISPQERDAMMADLRGKLKEAQARAGQLEGALNGAKDEAGALKARLAAMEQQPGPSHAPARAEGGLDVPTPVVLPDARRGASQALFAGVKPASIAIALPKGSDYRASADGPSRLEVVRPKRGAVVPTDQPVAEISFDGKSVNWVWLADDAVAKADLRYALASVTDERGVRRNFQFVPCATATSQLDFLDKDLRDACPEPLETQIRLRVVSAGEGWDAQGDATLPIVNFFLTRMKTAGFSVSYSDGVLHCDWVRQRDRAAADLDQAKKALVDSQAALKEGQERGAAAQGLRKLQREVERAQREAEAAEERRRAYDAPVAPMELSLGLDNGVRLCSVRIERK